MISYRKICKGMHIFRKRQVLIKEALGAKNPEYQPWPAFGIDEEFLLKAY